MYAGNNKDHVAHGLYRKGCEEKKCILHMGSSMTDSTKKYATTAYLLGAGGYFPEAVNDDTVTLEKVLRTYFICPSEDLTGKPQGEGSYIFFYINRPGTDHHSGNAYDGEGSSRVIIGKDRPENIIAVDQFIYGNKTLYGKMNHPSTANGLSLGGTVTTQANVQSWAKEPNIQTALGKYFENVVK
jgi:hypothetical protein